ncbi:MAG: polysaccharide deacetylase family protein [Candidatus Bathyarchaeia archaeon]
MEAPRKVLVFVTMDGEPVRAHLTPNALRLSPTGPPDIAASERSIRGFTAIARQYGFPTTLFLHPEVAVSQSDFLLKLRKQGVCLAMHLHPYKFGDGRYKQDLGAYSASEQRRIIEEAANVWEKALGQRPLYFRGGWNSANDNTFRVLQELGFKGGSLSVPGGTWPDHFAVWSGAEPYPHRAHLEFRQVKGNSNFVEVPMSADLQRLVPHEWLELDEPYNYEKIIRNILEDLKTHSPPYCTIGMDTHNDQDYSNPDHSSTVKCRFAFDLIRTLCAEMDVQPMGMTIESICELVLSGQP